MHRQSISTLSTLSSLHCDPVSNSPSSHPEAEPPVPPPLLQVATIPRFVPTSPPVLETLREQSPVCLAPASQPGLGAQSCLSLCDPEDCSPQAPPSVGFSRWEHWSGLPCPPPGGLPPRPRGWSCLCSPLHGWALFCLCLHVLLDSWVFPPSATVENAALKVDEHTRRSTTAGYTRWIYV